jgi:signal transduction histidine kinase
MTGMNRTKHLVEQMLVYSRIGVDSQSEPEVAVDLVEELQYLVNSQRTVLEGSGLRIELDVPARPVQVISQRGLLEILLRNLLDNACKHSRDPNGVVAVQLQLVNEGKLAVIHFRNMADPIAADEVPRLFEPYYRPVNTRAKGHGLGLAIAKEVVALNGWHLELTRNSTTEGIQFTCEIPVASVHN